MARQRKPLPDEPERIKVSPQAMGALKRFEHAVRDHAYIGTAHPDDHHHIENKLARTRSKLLEYLQY